MFTLHGIVDAPQQRMLRQVFDFVSLIPIQALLVSHVCACVNAFLREFGKGNVKPLLNLLENVVILRAADEGDAEALGTEAARTTNTMKIRISIGRKVIVDGKIDFLDIDATAEDVGSDADTLVEILELFVALDTVIGSA
jgi:hypothetical protein